MNTHSARLPLLTTALLVSLGAALPAHAQDTAMAEIGRAHV